MEPISTSKKYQKVWGGYPIGSQLEPMIQRPTVTKIKSTPTPSSSSTSSSSSSSSSSTHLPSLKPNKYPKVWEGYPVGHSVHHIL